MHIRQIAIGLTPTCEAPDRVDKESFTEEEVNVRTYSFWSSVRATLNVAERKGGKAAVLLVPDSGGREYWCNYSLMK